MCAMSMSKARKSLGTDRRTGVFPVIPLFAIATGNAFNVQTIVFAGTATVLDFRSRFRWGCGSVCFLGSGHDREILHLFEYLYVYKHVFDWTVKYNKRINILNKKIKRSPAKVPAILILRQLQHENHTESTMFRHKYGLIILI